MTDPVTTVYEIATDTHRGRTDEAGAPDIGHPARVAAHAEQTETT